MQDYVWLFGEPIPSNGDSTFGGSTIYFIDSVQVAFEERALNIQRTNGSISSPTGRLQIYSNGCFIANEFHVVLDSSKINPGNLYEESCGENGESGYNIPQGILMLHLPMDTNMIYAFHQRLELFPNESSFEIFVDKLFISKAVIDNGAASIGFINYTIIEDTLFSGLLTAVRHANNGDWWIMQAERNNNGYYKVLFSDTGVDTILRQNIGLPSNPNGSGSGQAVFSPDGTQYARYNKFDGVYLFDFDRSTGQLSNFKHLMPADTLGSGGVAFSPSGQYLYVTSLIYLYQYDLWADDIPGSKVLVDTYDGYLENGIFPTTFFLMQLAPDCRIYMSSTSSARHLHVINQPDLAGKACDFRQHSFPLPTWTFTTMPNFPNFRLGTGYAVCDTALHAQVVTSVAPEPAYRPRAGQLRAWPNPATAALHLDWTGSSADALQVYDLLGRLHHRERLPPGLPETRLDVSGWPAGLYVVRLLRQGRPVARVKVLVE